MIRAHHIAKDIKKQDIIEKLKIITEVKGDEKWKKTGTTSHLHQ